MWYVGMAQRNIIHLVRENRIVIWLTLFAIKKLIMWKRGLMFFDINYIFSTIDILLKKKFMLIK